MQTKEQMKRFSRNLVVGSAIYAVNLILVVKYGPSIPGEPWRSIVMILPMIGFCLLLWAIARQIVRSDEFVRKVHIENFALAAAITAGLSFTYGFLETIGYPKLSMFLVWGVMGLTWTGVSIYRGYRGYRVDG
jgi:hypothetical protein